MIQKTQTTNKPNFIEVVSQRDDLNKDSVEVEYVFRYGLEQIEVEQEGETVQMWQCYEVIEKAAFPLESKETVPFLLEMIYDEEETNILAKIELLNYQIPSVIREAV